MVKEAEVKSGPFTFIAIRHHWANQLPLIIAIVFLSYAAYKISVAFPITVQELLRFSIFGTDISLKLPFFAIFPVVGVFVLIHRLFNERLVLHPEYLLFREGLLSWRELSSRIEYEHVREINIGQNIFQKLFNIGELRVSTVATQIAAEVTMTGVRRPRRVKDEVYRRRHLILAEREEHERNHEHVLKSAVNSPD